MAEEMAHNPFFQLSMKYIDNNPQKSEIYSKLGQTYEQSNRNKLAYITAKKTRNITEDILDSIFGQYFE